MFNENSGLVRVWLRLLSQENSRYTPKDVPNISNLREVVLSLL